MPKVAIDYSTTVIYKIVCKDLNVDYTYVGHTTNLNKRRNQHKTVFNNEKSKNHNLILYQKIRENGGWDNWSVVEIEKYPCKDFNEACKRERFWVEKFGTLNRYIPTRTPKEYRNDNKKAITEKKKINRENNKEEIAKKKKYIVKTTKKK